MTLADNLLPKLSDWRPAGSGRHSWTESFADAGWAAHLEADHTDTLGCRAWEFTLTRAGDAPAGLTLRGWADSIASRATGLMEPLKVLEIDEERQEAQLRSTAPAKKGEDVLYYELKLSGLTQATLRRYQATLTPGKVREQVAYTLTHEALAKLAGDIAG
jgi:hypothetical protein